jgi:hypothetical protein
MIPSAHVAHKTVGRLRIKVPSKKGDHAYFEEIKAKLALSSYVTYVETNPVTSSVVVKYTGDLFKVADFARKAGLFDLRKFAPLRRPLFFRVSEGFRSWNGFLREMTDGYLDIPSAVFVSLLISGFQQISQGNISSPAWYTAFYYALGIFSRAGVEEFDEGEDLDGDFGDFGDDGGDGE